MCDHCDGSEVVSESSYEAVTIFQKSTNITNSNGICTNEMIDDVKLICDNEKQVYCDDICKTGSLNDDVCSVKKSSSSECSTDSEMAYKFVNKWELKCKCDVDCEAEEFEDELTREGVNVDEFEKDDDDDDNDDENIECTLAIIKPEAVINRRAIENLIRESDFAIQQTRLIRMTCEQVSEFYRDNRDDSDFGRVVTYMSSGPIVVHVIAKKRGIREWRMLMGPTKVSEARLYFPESVRARWGRKGRDYQNVVHGSASPEDAEREIHYFFPNFVIDPFPKWKKCENYLWQFANKLLAKGLIVCCREKPTDPILWLANWLLANNPNANRVD